MPKNFVIGLNVLWLLHMSVTPFAFSRGSGWTLLDRR